MSLSKKIQDLLEKKRLEESDTFGIMGQPPVFMQTDVPVAKEAEPEAEKKAEVIVEEEIKLSPKSYRTLHLAHLAEMLVNETIEQNEELEKHGLLVEGKMTPKAKEFYKKYFQTIFAS